MRAVYDQYSVCNGGEGEVEGEGKGRLIGRWGPWTHIHYQSRNSLPPDGEEFTPPGPERMQHGY